MDDDNFLTFVVQCRIVFRVKKCKRERKKERTKNQNFNSLGCRRAGFCLFPLIYKLPFSWFFAGHAESIVQDRSGSRVNHSCLGHTSFSYYSLILYN